MNEPTVIGSVVTLILALGSAVGWWLNRRDKRKDPLPKSAAEIAIAKEALGIVDRSAARLEQDVLREREERRSDRNQYKAERDADRKRITQLERDREEDRARITRLETLLGHAAAYIEALLRWAHGLRGAPKPPPLPAELHDLVAPELWVTGPYAEEKP